ncbi:MAG: hypothetical protein AAGC88_03080, partial [Bacteroidota bacterium]
EILNPHLIEAKRIRYYRETDIDRVSYECKFMLSGQHYSVEFTEQGSLEDIEILIDFDDVDKVAAESIVNSFSAYDRFKIRRTQRQFISQTGSSQFLDSVIRQAEGLTLRYEIVASLKKESDWKNYEMLFDDQGQLLNQREVIDRQTDMILYR